MFKLEARPILRQVQEEARVKDGEPILCSNWNMAWPVPPGHEHSAVADMHVLMQIAEVADGRLQERAHTAPICRECAQRLIDQLAECVSIADGQDRERWHG